MRLSVLAVLFAFAGVVESHGAAVLRGQVLEEKLGGAAMKGVGVHVDGKYHELTKADGYFRLDLPDREPGEKVSLVLEKTGYEVVNDWDLEFVLLKDAHQFPPLKLLLCRKDQRDLFAARYIRLASLEALEINYRQQVEELRSSQRATVEELAQLKRKYKQAREAAEKGAEDLAKRKPEERSEIELEATRLFTAGKIDEALALLSDEKLRQLDREAEQERSKAERRVQEAEQAMQRAVSARLMKAQMHALKLQFKEAEDLCVTVATDYPQSFDAQYALGNFSRELNRFAKAEEAYERCLELARHGSNAEQCAMTLNSMGLLYWVQNRPEEALKSYEEALKIRRELAEKSPEAYRPDVAVTLNNLGNLHCIQNRAADAQKAYEEALSIRRELAEKSPEEYRPDVATTLNNLGILHWAQNRQQEALEAYEEALMIYRELVEKTPEAYRPDVAMALNNLGNLNRDQGRATEAMKEYEEALMLRRELAEKNPEAHRPDEAMILNNLGSLLSDQGRAPEAQKAFEEALTIRRELAEKNPEAYRVGVAATLNSLGVLHSIQNQTPEAQKAYEEALCVYRELAEKNPEAYRPDLAITLNNLGNLHREQGQATEALKKFEEAKVLYQGLVRTNPERFSKEFETSERACEDMRRLDRQRGFRQLQLIAALFLSLALLYAFWRWLTRKGRLIERAVQSSTP